VIHSHGAADRFPSDNLVVADTNDRKRHFLPERDNGDRDGIDRRRRYCIGCIGMGDVYHSSANNRFGTFLTIRFVLGHS
jgi:hypothetical protein